MGLEFLPSNVRMSYSRFHKFRCDLAAEIGINFNEMEGCCENGIPWDGFTDDIVPFLKHSDCDGELGPDECRRIAPRLRELVAGWQDSVNKSQALELADDMERIAAYNGSLLFY